MALFVRMKVGILLATALLTLFVGAACGRATPEPTPIDPGSWRVHQIGRMSVERAAHQATLLQTGQVLVTGGCGGQGCDLVHASVELFDPATQSFQPAPPMSTPRASHIAIALSDSRVLVSGGWTGERATASAEIYDPTSGQWAAVGDMVEARSSHIAVTLPDGNVLIIGGGSGGLADLTSAEIFDASTSTFLSAGQMRTNHYLATLMKDGRVLLTGGQNPEGEITRSAEIFDPATGEFQLAGEMSVARVKHATALLVDGRVLVLGGSDDRGYSGRFASTEIYDPMMEAFLPGPDLHHGRHKIRDAVAVLNSGAVLVAGGASQLEVFDPDEQTFVLVEGELSGPQMFATATLLPNGNVLVLGGYDDRTRSSDAAWLVQPDAELQP